MSDWEKTIIPLDEAYEILCVFGVEPSSRECQRWLRDDGFRHVDFEGILNSSDVILNVDWRECLQDAVEVMLRQLRALGIAASADLGADGDEGVFQIEGQSAEIQFVPAEEDDFDRVIADVNRLLGHRASYRKFRSSEGSDGWSYAVLKKEDWEKLEASAGATLRIVFM